MIREACVCVVTMALVFAAAADPVTGWRQTAGGTYSYADAENWVGGEVNGIFGPDLALSGDQTIVFGSDTTLANGLTFGYVGDFTVTLVSDGTGAKTLTLGGDVTSAMSGKGTVTIGGADGEALTLDLGGEMRTVSAVSVDGTLQIPAKISHGALTIAGDRVVRLSGANDYADGTTVSGGASVYLESPTALGTGPVSVNGKARFLNSDTLTLTADNAFYLNSTDVTFQMADKKQLNIGAGVIVVTNTVKLWTEGKNSLVIGGRIVDADGVCKPNKIEKWGGQTLITYSPFETRGDELRLGNGTWEFGGPIYGADLAVLDLDAEANTQHLKLSGINSFTGTLDIRPNTLYVYAMADVALPAGAQVRIGKGSALVCSATLSASGLLADGRVTTDSSGILCLGANETADVDLTDYPFLALGANGGDRTLTGALKPAADGVWRLGGGGRSLILSAENALTGAGTLEVHGSNGGGNVVLAQSNGFSGGARVLQGGTLEIRGDTATLPNSDVVVHGGTFYVNSTGSSGCRRVGTVTLRGGYFNYAGNKSHETSDSVDRLVLDVRDPAYGTVGGVCHIRLYANGKTATFTAGELVRKNDMIFRIGGNANGDKLRVGGKDLATDANTAIFKVGNSQEYLDALVGGGGAPGTATVSVYPYAFVENGSYNDSLVTYDANGFRGLDIGSEYVKELTPETPATANVRLKFGSTTEIATATTVNSIFQEGTEAKTSSYLTGTGTLKVASGVVVLGYHRNGSPYFQCPVDFGARQGVVCFGKGKASYWNGAVHGTAGAIFLQTADSAEAGSGGTGLQCKEGTVSDSTLTGDIVVHGRIDTEDVAFLPGGADRPGDICVNGYCNLKGGDGARGYSAITGVGWLFRSGETLQLGVDGRDADFAGGFIEGTSYVKVGSGRQRVGGKCTHTGSTTVKAGTLQFDGEVSGSAVTVKGGAKLAGSGDFAMAVAVEDGGALEIGSRERGAADALARFDGGLSFAGTATLTVLTLDRTTVAGLAASSVTSAGRVTVVLDGPVPRSAEYLIASSDTPIAATFVRGAKCGPLSLRNGGRELWMTKNAGMTIRLR